MTKNDIGGSVPKVSVLIPCYNAARYLALTIESALAQTHPDVEVFVIDDGSTDDSAAIAARYPVTLLRNWRNMGQAAALNTGLAHAQGEYVAFLDSDDLWAATKLERCVAALEAAPQAVLAYTNGYAVDSNGVEDRGYALAKPGHRTPDVDGMLLNCVIDCPAQVVARRRDLEYFTPGLQSNDHDMWIRMRERGPFIFVDEPLSFYRKHGAQISLRRRQWEDGFQILAAAQRRYGYARTTIRKRLAVLHARLGLWDIKNGHRGRGLTHLARSGLLDPVRAVLFALGRDPASS
jgi:glycosyltransferase involved in cell wall biosynthesis